VSEQNIPAQGLAIKWRFKKGKGLWSGSIDILSVRPIQTQMPWELKISRAFEFFVRADIY
jgi:hypothetical protein